MISSAVTNRKSLKKSVCFRKNKKRKTTLTDAVRRVFAYQREYSGKFGVFSISQEISICKVGSVRFKSFLNCYPDALIGLYDRKLTIGDLIDDLSEYFTDVMGSN